MQVCVCMCVCMYMCMSAIMLLEWNFVHLLKVIDKGIVQESLRCSLVVKKIVIPKYYNYIYLRY